MSPPSSMACIRLSLAVLFCLALLAATDVGARPTATSAPTPAPAAAAAWEGGLAERLDRAMGSQQCWEAMAEIKSCTGEIILFFLNGEAYLGPGCCRAIRVIEMSCWGADAVMSFIGFTPEEGDMLKGYCDAGDDGNGGGGGQNGTPPQPRSAVVDDGVAVRESVARVAGREGSVHR
ncbi:hypothetical protein ACP70R_013981 [Stipagrostis hirtigluma subsp. patula]